MEITIDAGKNIIQQITDIAKSNNIDFDVAALNMIDLGIKMHLASLERDAFDDPSADLNLMLKKIKDKYHFIFASRYLTNGGSEDDTMLTFLGNKIFTFLGNILFNLKLSDILFTFILGETVKFKKLNLKSNDFTLCTEIPIKIKKNKYKYNSIPSYERSRLGGKKKVNEFIDGSLILISLLKFFFNKND